MLMTDVDDRLARRLFLPHHVVGDTTGLAADGLVGDGTTRVCLLVASPDPALMPRIRADDDTPREVNAVRTQIEITSKPLRMPAGAEAGVAQVTFGADGVTNV
jgi:hypothetical protein